MENPERVTYFAATDARGKYIPFGIKAKDRDRHMYVIGKTGMGKSTLLENMAIQDLRNGEGFAFIDPHGGTVDRILDFIPENRIKDIVYIAPFDLEHPIAFNVMEDVGYDKRHLVVSGLMATFKKIWEDMWSARMEYILTNTLLALLEYPDSTLLSVNRMYTDKLYRQKVVDYVKDPVVKDFWTKEFANYGDRYTQEATPAIQNKVGQFTGNPLIRNIIGQPKSSFDIRTMMDEKKILLINLSKGLVGETNMRLLGSMLTTRIFLAAMSRANLAAAELSKLPPFYFYVDEFQNFANQTFAEILSEARKYKLNLVIAHQYIEQMEEEVRDAVFGNVGTTVVFRVGPFDAEVLETIFMPRFTKEDVVGLDRRQVYLTLMIDGVGSAPFSAVTIPPIEAPPVSYREHVIAASREQFTAARGGVENVIIEELSESAASPAPQDARMRKKPAPLPPKPTHPVLAKEYMKIQPAPAPLPRPAAAAPTQITPPIPIPQPQPAPTPPPVAAPTPPPAPPVEEVAPPKKKVLTESPISHEPKRIPSALMKDHTTYIQRPKEFRAFPLPAAQVPKAPKPKPLQRTPDDLKALLRDMSVKTGAEKEKKQTDHHQSLKGALAEVMARNPATQPAKVTPPTSTGPIAPRQPSPSPASKQPFEVSEVALRKVLKGDA